MDIQKIKKTTLAMMKSVSGLIASTAKELKEATASQAIDNNMLCSLTDQLNILSDASANLRTVLNDIAITEKRENNKENV